MLDSQGVEFGPSLMEVPMLLENFWLTIKAIAAFLDGSRADTEQTLDRVQEDLLKKPAAERRSMRRFLILIIAQLSRLEVRLSEHDGPNKATL
jgi:hypothetical protein